MTENKVIDRLFIFLLISVFFSQFAMKFTGDSNIKHIPYIFVIVGIAFLLKKFRISKKIFAISSVYIIFLLLRGIADVIEDFSYRPIYQLFHELKFFLFFIFCYQVSFNENLIAIIEKILKITLSLSLFCVFIQYALPEIYRSIFHSGDGIGLFIHRGYNLQRAEGAFIHSSVLALFSIFAFLYFYFICDRVLFFWKTVSILLLALSLQRQEILFFLGFIIIKMYNSGSMYPQHSNLKKMLIFCLGSGIIFVLFSDLIYLFESFFNLTSSQLSPRTMFFTEGINIFKTAPVFGVGLGQFASHGAAVFGSFFYDTSVISATWWYQEGLYLYDSFWPHLFVEQGAVGFLMFVGILFAIYRLIYAHRSTITASYSIWIFLFILSVSIGSAVYMSPIHLTLLFMCIGSLNYER
jgi:hypothetical protein